MIELNNLAFSIGFQILKTILGLSNGSKNIQNVIQMALKKPFF